VRAIYQTRIRLYAQIVGEVEAALETAFVPFLDLARTNGPLRDAILADISDLIDSNAFTNGPQVREFEEAWAEYCGTRYCVGIASGLDALRLALIGLDIGPGDEVIVPANTFVASAEAITQAGATPVLVDASESDWNIDVEAAEAAITPRTRAIMPVHLYGQIADMLALRGIAERHGLALLEDACQAHGATRDGLRAGAAGTAAAFSFYPGKNLGAFGDAGALVTNDAELLARMRSLREHGQRAKYDHEREGFTARLDSIQALVLTAKLPHLDGWTDDRKWVAQQYIQGLASLPGIVVPPVANGSDPVWHLFVVRVQRPKEFAEFLRARGIHSSRHYPDPVHLTGAYRMLGHTRGDFPVAEAIAQECVSLPIFPGQTAAEVQAVVSAVEAYCRRAGPTDQSPTRP
jgi:dTDP-4-amino-4,6-dideoxygalactose transaminase